ncbi:unnamed protein product [Trifolium pratense]|uniref:Uncharacterized protein n=1 Tax=Trifolium pratense TaxID=57577 RepID=A0ACB0JNV0_TRIPR|nr:unnamed protein product [Trifolium pratense]
MKGVTENGEGDFYGVIENIFEIEYNYLDYKKTVVLFYCKWFDPSNRGTRYDSKTNTVDIKMNKHYPLYDPFAMAHNVRQVHYVPYPSTTRDKRGWCAAITSKPRGLIEKNEIDEREDEPYQEDEMSNVDDVIAVETFNQLCVQEEAEEVPSDGDVDEEDMNPDEENFDDDNVDDDIDDIPPAPGVGRGRGRAPRRRALPRRVVRNRWLEAAIERIFNKKATKRLSTLLFEARKKIKKDPSKPPLWLAGNSYPMLCRRWEEEEYIAKCIKNKANGNTDEANRACVHSGGSKSAGTLRLEFIQQFGRPPTFMEMNDMMHRYADSGEWTGARAQEVSRLTQIWVEEYNASQLRLPPHRRDNEDVRRNKMSLAFVKNAGGATRGRKFAAGCTSSLYASDPTGLRDVTYTSSSSSSTGRSRPTQREETDDEYEARMRATYREEFRDEFEASFDDRVDVRVQHILQEFFAQQRAPAPAGGGVGSSSQASARQNQNAGEQEYRPDLSSMVNLNQLPEYREGDPVLSMSIEDMSQMLNEPVHLQFFDPTGQTSGSSSGGSGRNNQQTAFTEYQRSLNPQQDFIIPHENPNQPQGNFFPNQAPINFVHRPVARPPSRTSLPGVIIHEEGRGRGRGRSRQPTDTGKGKRPLYQPPDQR